MAKIIQVYFLHEQGQQGGRIIFFGMHSQSLQSQLFFSLDAKLGTLGCTNGTTGMVLGDWLTSMFFSEQENKTIRKKNAVKIFIFSTLSERQFCHA